MNQHKKRRCLVNSRAKVIAKRMNKASYKRSVHSIIFDLAFYLNDFIHVLPDLADDVQTTVSGKSRGEIEGAVEVLLEIHGFASKIETLISEGLEKAAKLK